VFNQRNPKSTLRKHNKRLRQLLMSTAIKLVSETILKTSDPKIQFIFLSFLNCQNRSLTISEHFTLMQKK
jgi:hypothetical protein